MPILADNDRQRPGGPEAPRFSGAVRILAGCLLSAILVWCDTPGVAAQLIRNPYVPLASSEAELESFRAIELEARPGARLPLIATFLESFPESELRYLVLRNRWRVLVDARAESDRVIWAARDGIDSADRFFGTRLEPIGSVDQFLGTRIESSESVPESLSAAAELKWREIRADYYRSMVASSRRLDDLDSMAEYTDRAVEAVSETLESYGRMVPEGTVDYERRAINHRAVQLRLLRDAMLLFRSAGNPDRALAYGERALDVDPEDLLTLMIVSSAMVDGGSPPEPYLDRALEYASRALGYLDRVFPDVPDGRTRRSERVVSESSLRSTIGFAHYHQGDYAAAESELVRALEGLRKDPAIHYRLGLVYSITDRLVEAVGAFARADYLGNSQADPQVRSSLERVYEQVYGSLDSIDAFVEREAAALELER